ncbi:MAG: ABC transporter permease [Chloroflexota bacterium]
MIFANATYHLLLRHVRTTLRMPIWIAVTLVQPMIWLTLYGQLFKRVVDIPGFQAASYVEFIAPGVLIMNAVFGSAWSGMGLVNDLQVGVIDRMLATPVPRGAIIAGRVLHAALTVAVQSIIVIIVALVLGASVPGGIAGAAALILLAGLLGSGFAAISSGIALLARREETLIAVVNFFGMPLIFLSSAYMAADLMPGWIQAAAAVNPVNWAVEGGRAAMQGTNGPDVLRYAGQLAAFTLVACVFATRAFTAYRRSV